MTTRDPLTIAPSMTTRDPLTTARPKTKPDLLTTADHMTRPDPLLTPAPRPKRQYTRHKVVARVAARRKAIAAIVPTLGPMPTVRTVHRVLNEAGWRASLGTTHRDMVALGLAG